MTQVCKCGHSKSDHRTNAKKNPEYFDCQWWDCSCNKFNFGETKNTVSQAKQYDSMFEKTPKPLTMDNLTKDGRPPP